MRAGRVRLPLALALAALCPAGAAAEPIFTGRVSLTGMIYAESDGRSGDVTVTSTKLATTALLGYADLRGVVEGKRLWKDRLDLRLDLRLRLTGNLNFDRKFDSESPTLTDELIQNPALSLGGSSRGYVGGPEYDLREAYGLLRATDTLTVQAGRMFIREADTIKIDGARLLRKFGPRWEGGAFFGGYPNPYSRSLVTDYVPPCGAGVAGSRAETIQESVGNNEKAQGTCVSEGPQLSLGLGLTARYDYSTLWGAVGLVGTIFGGIGDGGPVQPLLQPDVTTLNVLQPPGDNLDAPRIYLSWLNAWRPAERLDLFSDLVFDFYGGAGPQLTRLVALATLRLLKEDRLTLRLGYSHLSSLAINMFLNRMLYNRRSGAALSSQLGFVENNLTVMRTGRDEVRVTADAKLKARLAVFVDGRFRARYLAGGGSVPDASDAGLFSTDQRPLAGDVTLGLRDLGTFREVRAGLAYTALVNFRAQNHILTLDVGRDFWGERLSIDFQYVFAYTLDEASSEKIQMEQSCSGATPYMPVCFGQRKGSTHELGLTVTANPGRKLFLLLDYRLIALLSDTPPFGEPIPTVISNALLVRGEYRW